MALAIATVGCLSVASCHSEPPKKASAPPPPPKPSPQLIGTAHPLPPKKPKEQEVKFASHGAQLYGYVTKPNGNGPFPAILYSHGSEKNGGQKVTLRDFFVQHGYVFFVPHRSGHGKSPGATVTERRQKAKNKQKAEIRLHEEHAEETADALAFLKKLPYVNKHKIVAGGCSYGGIQSLLVAERGLGLKAAIDWAGGAMSWKSSPLLQKRMIKAVEKGHVPTFFLQARNDYSTEPTEVLGAQAERRNKTYKAKVYPPVGATHAEGHAGFCGRETRLWGGDVLGFIKQHLGGP